METRVIGMVLIAALLHAVWNALVKGNGKRFTILAMISFTGLIVSLMLIPFVAVPKPESWMFIVMTMLLHTGYKLFLLKSYQYGDLSHVYPIARGAGPLIVSLVSFVIIGEVLSVACQVGVMLIAIGIMSLAFNKGLHILENKKALRFALITGTFIASYTMVDGMGARKAGNPHSYLVWIMFMDAILFLTVFFIFNRKQSRNFFKSTWKQGMLAGLFSYTAYGIVIWAMTKAPIAPVAALRETSIILAVFIGSILLKERVNPLQVLATGVVLAGAILVRRN